ncbi:hypothetical protein CJ192_07245 [Anaerococcus hydrogenalis]|uniref:Uncharacterized protein n=1 Tax=Anaerococcus hydrogenalis TaxID=33029 RepID=A0A2N6UHF9_9FIRM|nr:hypothetical protein CJ192_07245 [Anaerococcus hydrogenalis]
MGKNIKIIINTSNKINIIPKSTKRFLDTKTHLLGKFFRAITLVLGINMPNQGIFIGSKWVSDYT